MNTSFLLRVPLTTPVLMTGGYLTLDGLLAVAFETMTGRPAAPDDIPLVSEAGIKKGSAAFFNQGRVSSKTMFSRLSAHELAEVPDKVLPRRGGRYLVNQESGEFKASTTKFIEVETEFACWFGVGDPEKVADYLRFVPGIGRKASLGYGQINHDEIEIEDAPDCALSLYGSPARPIPVSAWRGGPAQQAMASVHHPYWESQRVPCVVPVTRFFKRTDLMASAVNP